MTDYIVMRLRRYADWQGLAGYFSDDLKEAADEIERGRARVDLLSGYLRGALNVIEMFVSCDTEDARAALAGEKTE